jgi:hypothetical protein
MTHSIIWLHDEALRLTHPVFATAPACADAVFIWDDTYLKNSGYSLKRLIFIYETLCTVPIDIIHGDTLTMLRTLAATSLYIPYSPNPFVQNIISELSAIMEVHVVQDVPFVRVSEDIDVTRFFKYWKRAEQSALMFNGGDDV